jgi:hypothetical protein
MASNLCGPAGSSGTLLIDIKENSLNSVLLMDKEIKNKFHGKIVLKKKMKLSHINICNINSDSMRKSQKISSFSWTKTNAITYASMPESEASQ